MAFPTFHLVGLGWVLFGVESFSSARRFFTGLFSLDRLVRLPRYRSPVLLAAALTAAIDEISEDIVQASSRSRRMWQPVLVTAGVLILAGLAELQALRGFALFPFVYGKF